MKCPYCGKEMEPGFIFVREAASYYWLPESENSLQLLGMDTEKLKKLNGVVIKGFTPGLKSRKIDACICRDCEKGIFSFNKDAELIF